LVVQNAPLPSVKSWLADRLPIVYHTIGFIAPSCPTLARKVKELDFASLRCTRSAPCAGNRQHQTPRVLPGSDTVSVTRRGETMFTKRVAATDVRIGLNLLGENGRMLLREYAKTSTAYCTKEREQ